MNPPIAFQNGLTDFRAGRLAQAEGNFRELCRLYPDHPDAQHMLGLTLFRLGKYTEARGLITKAVARMPQVAEYRGNLAMVLLALQLPAESADEYARALALKPDYLEALNGHGVALKALGRFDESQFAFERAIQLRPNYAEALDNYASLLSAMNKDDEAIELYEKAIAANPNYGSAHNNLGNVLHKKGLSERALVSYRKALELDPARQGMIWNNIGNVLLDSGHLDHAMAAYDQAVRDQSIPGYFSGRLLAMNFMPDLSPEKIFADHRRFDLIFASKFVPQMYKPNPARSCRLRIGYLSPDFRQHSVATFIRGLLANHDRAQFEIFCYADVANPDAVTAELQSLAEHWRPIQGIPEADVAGLIADDCIDILIDLAGHTGSNRLLVFARKPAPVQMTYLGYPNTTGLTSMDYRLTDAIADPPGQTEQFHSEKILRIPDCFLCYTPPVDAPPAGKLPAASAGHITFGCFNLTSKIGPHVLDAWRSILQQVPDSHLFLKTRGLADQFMRERIIQFFQEGGIAADRLDMRAWVQSQREHQELFSRVDIALDTFPYNGTTITCEALWMGVPVVTFAGRMHAARVGASILHSVGLDDWIAPGPEEYILQAVAKARNLGALAEVRRSLRNRMASSSLIDAKAFARKIETILRDAMELYSKGNG